MKKFSLFLVGLFCLVSFTTPGYCFLDKLFKKGTPFERGLVAYRAADYKTAIKEWEPLAEQGNTSAQWNLYLSYTKECNDEKAVHWCTIVAKNGHADAQCELAEIYDGGTMSVTKNQRTAAYWYTQAAQQGNAQAQWRLGWLYRHGEGVLEDLEKARQLYTQAAYQGIEIAQSSLGDMYYDGDGGSKDAIQAYAWWSLYISQKPDNFDTSFVKERLQRLVDTGIYIGKKTSGVSFTTAKDYKKMTPEEIGEAKKLTRKLYNKIYGELRPEN